MCNKSQRFRTGTIPIYRAWNNRIDSNHRYTTDAAVQQAMIAKGYIAEGYGPGAMPVAMCSPVIDPGAKTLRAAIRAVLPRAEGRPRAA